MPYKIITLAVGFCGMAMTFVTFQQNDRKRILLCQLISTVFFCTHYAMLGKYTGAILNAVAAVRAVIYANRDRKFFGSVLWLWLFIGISAAAGVLTWEGPISALPTAGMIVGSISVWVKKPRTIRILSFIPSPMWMTYNIISGSIPGVVTEVFVMTSISIAIVRYDILKKGKKLSAENAGSGEAK